MRRPSEIAKKNGFTHLVYVDASCTRPFKALVEPDVNLGDFFRAWAVDQETFVIVDGTSINVYDLQ